MKKLKKQVKGKQLIRNSTAEFLIFSGQSGEQSIEARYEDETIWLTQKLMAQLFDVTIPTVNEHLKNIFADGELPQDSVIRKFRTTAASQEKRNPPQDRSVQNMVFRREHLHHCPVPSAKRNPKVCGRSHQTVAHDR